MSFLGGAECSTAANPLSQFTKHVQDDKSLQRDRLVGSGPGGLQGSMRSQHMGGGADNMMNEFLQQSAQLPQGPGPASPFAMEQMRRELERAQHSGSPAWAAEFDPGIEATSNMSSGIQERPMGFNPAEFAKFQRMNATARTASPKPTLPHVATGYQRPMYGMGMGGMGMGMGGMGMMQQPYAPQHLQQPSQESSKGKERMVELDEQDWEAQFAQLEQTDQEALDQEANARIGEELNELDRSVDAVDFGDFESVWRGIKAETERARQLVSDENIMDEAFANDLNSGEMDHWDGFDGLHTHSGRDPPMGDYMFEQDNLFKDITNPFDEGVKIMEEGGNLSLAALAFEAAVQQDPQHTAAWVRLGESQAQNEKETPAIRALEQALKLDPSSLEALMGLAVSYTNEGYESTAYRTLERWLATKYPTLITDPLSSDADIGFTDRQQLHQKVTELFIAAAQLSPSGEQMDPDVQVGLGVLFYGVEEYEKAVDCFGAALASTESGTSNSSSQIHLLWNRLGATLANSGRSEEAIDAYSRALSARPNFVRARYNLGVSCINIGCFAEAAQHLLGALAMHGVVQKEGKQRVREVVGEAVSDQQIDEMVYQQNQSTNLYDTLRRVFGQMGRRDLADRVGPGMDVEAFRGEFEF